MTRPIQLEKRMRVVYRPYNNQHVAWDGWKGKVLAVDHGTNPWQFVRVQLQSPHDENWQPITWTQRENLRKLPDRRVD